jgi:transcriptional regulator with XRE-family HTH domain
MEFHEKLARLILAHPGSQNDQAVDLDIDKSHYSRLARGAAQPTRAQLVRISRYYGADLEWLADDDMAEPPPAEPPIHPTILDLLSRMKPAEAIARLSRIDLDARATAEGRHLPSDLGPPEPPAAPSRRRGFR